MNAPKATAPAEHRGGREEMQPIAANVARAPDTPKHPELRGSRSECPTCGLIFAGERSFDGHRVGATEADSRRCLSIAEMLARGFRRKPSGVWTNAEPASRGPVPDAYVGQGRVDTPGPEQGTGGAK